MLVVMVQGRMKWKWSEVSWMLWVFSEETGNNNMKNLQKYITDAASNGWNDTGFDSNFFLILPRYK